MKTLFLLFSILILSYSTTYAQGMSATPETVTSGETVTFKATSESIISYYSFINSVIVSGLNSPVSLIPEGSISFYNKSNLAPTTFKYKVTSSSTENVTVIINISGTVNNDINGTQNGDWRTGVQITVKPKPTTTTYYNDAISQTFYNNTCASGYSSDPYVYQVTAGTYSSIISKADANSKAQNAINSNGQNSANATNPCKLVYYSDAMSGIFQRNSCGLGSEGSQVSYTVAAKKYQSTISLQDANQKAINDLNTNGQAYANINGTCSAITYVRIEATNKKTKNTKIPGEAHATIIETYADLQIRLYSDAACTQPLAVTIPTSIIVKRNRSGYASNGATYNVNDNLTYNISSGMNNYVIGNMQLNYRATNLNGIDTGVDEDTTAYDVVNNGNAYYPIASKMQ